ncbi:hypothetical protein EV668_0726 [Enterovirga rhinocerotis]|uniref:Uncharacterized protein n=1 Tax=Enterovirga rhinocerotis TaxID=1339210 RepID=A0A4R7C4M8_9HYPH|nr:hypothetical protein EV668_0726 [Enterovirga rhinocerotis]
MKPGAARSRRTRPIRSPIGPMAGRTYPCRPTPMNEAIRSGSAWSSFALPS